MFSIVFFIIVVAIIVGMLLETLGDEIHSFVFRLIDGAQGNKYEEELREFHQKRVRKT